MFNISGRHFGVAFRYPEENTNVALLGIQKQILHKGLFATGTSRTSTATLNELGLLNTWDAASGGLGAGLLALDPSQFVSEATYI